MQFLESAGRLGATLVTMAHTRLELAALEVEEASQRFLRQLLVSLLALFLVGIAVVLAAFFVILVFWDSYRLQAVLAMAALFLAGGVLLALKVRRELRAAQPLLGGTLGEMRKDIECLRATTADEGQGDAQ